MTATEYPPPVGLFDLNPEPPLGAAATMLGETVYCRIDPMFPWRPAVVVGVSIMAVEHPLADEYGQFLPRPEVFYRLAHCDGEDYGQAFAKQEWWPKSEVVRGPGDGEQVVRRPIPERFRPAATSALPPPVVTGPADDFLPADPLVVS